MDVVQFSSQSQLPETAVMVAQISHWSAFRTWPMLVRIIYQDAEERPFAIHYAECITKFAVLDHAGHSGADAEPRGY